MKAQFILEVEIDEDDTAAHVEITEGNEYPLLADPSEWDWIDLEGALSRELATDPQIIGFTVIEG